MTVRHLLSGAAIAAASTLLFAGGAKAQGVPLLPGNFVTAPTLAGLTTGSTLLSTSSSAFNVTNPGTTPQTITGTLVSSVYRNAANTLDFFYQVTSTGNSNSSITSFSITSFAGTTTSVAQTADNIGSGSFTAGTIASTLDSRESGLGEGLTFSFIANTIGPNSSSYAQFVRTTATTFTTSGQAGVAGSGVTANLSTNVIAALPPTQAPEPGSLALAATGLMGAMGMVGIRRRRSAK